MNPPTLRAGATLAILLVLGGCGDDGVEAAHASDALVDEVDLDWDTRRIRHLFNRAGFGLRRDEVEEWLELGPERAVDELLRERPAGEPFYVHYTLPSKYRGLDRSSFASELRLRSTFFKRDRVQLRNYAGRWIRSMLAHSDPLRDRMTLFWLGLFTSGYEVISRQSQLVIRQHRFLRENALGNYGDLLRGIVHQPAMLVYLDNNENLSEHPNENLARELMELFSLGEGNYTEHDVREAARALTGFTVTADVEQDFLFDEDAHDHGDKEILGRTGKLDGDDLVEILLEQKVCARWIAGRLIAYLEGAPPADDRLEEYADHLRGSGYELEPFLRKLLLDPEFYRDEIIGARVMGPVDFVVASCRRLAIEPPPLFLADSADILGKDVFEPPSVKGWEEGPAWITTSSLIDRGNVAGLMVGVIDVEQFFELVKGPDAPPAGTNDMGESSAMGREAPTPTVDAGDLPGYFLRLARDLGPGYVPELNLSWRMEQLGARTDAQIVDALLEDLLAIRVPPDTRNALRSALASTREEFGIPRGDLAGYGDLAEEALRRTAHLILCLPEAQLH